MVAHGRVLNGQLPVPSDQDQAAARREDPQDSRGRTCWLSQGRPPSLQPGGPRPGAVASPEPPCLALWSHGGVFSPSEASLGGEARRWRLGKPETPRLNLRSLSPRARRKRALCVSGLHETGRGAGTVKQGGHGGWRPLLLPAGLSSQVDPWLAGPTGRVREADACLCGVCLPTLGKVPPACDTVPSPRTLGMAL